ncbi:MmgE/PrpD family protein [Halomonas sp.]|uniref:MmgE/PrpD family protein n=1 Tax=Halomonas sp. TaxID=1486246 RepID=UPI002579A7C9|nr:MmgE/PrpD family protein [Halomonas sp.]MCJ8287009.1 MmgE/PrpD family protein [Halomonas sp.]NQY71725.1 MmgE/PrpD family protein [Halomonas sp.]
MSTSRDVIHWILTSPLDRLDDAQCRHAKRCLIDLIGVAAGATDTALAEHARRYVRVQHAGGRPLLFASSTASATGVALHGAWLIDALDAHDGQVLTKGHAGVAILPGLLALPEIDKVSGRDFLGLLAMGYEIATRAGIALHASSPDYHTSGAWNALGVAAVTARLKGLDPAQLEHALGIAEFYGPRSQMMRCIDHPTMLKDGSGWGAQAGVAATLLAEDGFTGAPAVTLCDEQQAAVWGDLGRRDYLSEQYFKAYPVCRWAQPAVEAVLAIPAAERQVDNIERIEITTFHEARRLHTIAPTTTEQAQYSLPWSVACALDRGTIDVAAISRDLGDDDLVALSRRVTITECDDCNARFPAERWASATLHLRDGRRIQSPAMEARGNPHNPLSDDEIAAKFQALASPVLGARANEIEEVVGTLETRPIGDLLRLLGQP